MNGKDDFSISLQLGKIDALKRFIDPELHVHFYMYHYCENRLTRTSLGQGKTFVFTIDRY